MKDVIKGKIGGPLYMFLYGWRWWDDPPLKTSRCAIFWLLLISLFVGWPIIVPFFALMRGEFPGRYGMWTPRRWPNFSTNGWNGPIPLLLWTSGVLFLVGSMGYWLFAALGFWGIKIPNRESFSYVSFAIGFAAWVIIIIFGIFISMFALRDKLKDVLDERAERAASRPKDPSVLDVVRGFVKDVKTRTCRPWVWE